MSDFLASKLFLAAVLFALLVIGIVTMLLVNRYLHVASAGGDLLVRGRAARHVELLSRTLVVRAHPLAVVDVVTPAVDPYRFDPAERRDREVAVWVTKLPPAAGKTRLAIRPAPVAGWTEVGVLEYPWWSRFPQGARPVKRVMTAAAAALAATGWQVVERRRWFTPGEYGRTADGPRLAREFDPAVLTGTGTALDATEIKSYEKRARRGEALAPQAGRPDVDAELMTLLLDPEDTLVTRRTADALMARRDLVGLRLVLAADVRAEEDTSRWLWSAVGGRRAAALGHEDAPLSRDLAHLGETDPDPRIRERAGDLAEYLFRRSG